jgi:hypothetical protein
VMIATLPIVRAGLGRPRSFVTLRLIRNLSRLRDRLELE